MKILLVTERSFMADAVIRALYLDGHEVREIWTEYNPARMFRRSTLRFVTNNPRCVGTQVRKHRIPVRQVTPKEAGHFEAYLDEIGPVDLLLSAGTHLIFPKRFLDRFQGRAFNFHPSMLPRYRGPRPRFAMIFDGVLDRHGGVTLHQLTPRIDAGDIVAQKNVPRSRYRNVMAWDLALADTAHLFIRNELAQYLKGTLSLTPQDESQAHYDALTADETFITGDWPYAKIKAVLDQGYGIYGWTFARLKDAQGRSHQIAVYPELTQLGPPSGEPPTISKAHIEMDAGDCRVRIARETRLKRYGNKIERYRTLLSS